MQQRGREWRGEEDWDQERSRRWQGESAPREGWHGSSRQGMGQEGYRGEGYRGESYRGEGDGSRGWRGAPGFMGPRSGMQGGGGYGRFGGPPSGYGGGWQQEESPYGGGQYTGQGYGGQGEYGGPPGYGGYGPGYPSYAQGGYGVGRGYPERGYPERGYGERGYAERSFGGAPHASGGSGMEEEIGRGGHEYRGREYGLGQGWAHRGAIGSRMGSSMGIHGGFGGFGGNLEGDWGRGSPEGSSSPLYSSYSRTGAGSVGRRSHGRGPKNYQRSDERIREDVCDRLSSTDIDCSDIEIRVEQGEVMLIGTIDSGEARREVERVAEQIAGVRDVTNQIRMKRDFDEGDSGRARSQTTGSHGSQSQTSGGSGTSGPQGRQTTSQGKT